MSLGTAAPSLGSQFDSSYKRTRAVTYDCPRGKGRARRGKTPGLHQKILPDVSGDELGHLEHTNLTLAVKYRLERIVRVDHRSFLFILTTVFLDVVPQFFREFGTRERFRANDGREFFIRLDGAHECGVRLAFGLFGFGFRHDR